MWPQSYWPASFWPGSYWPKTGATPPVTIPAPIWVDEVQAAFSGAEAVQTNFSGVEEIQI